MPLMDYASDLLGQSKFADMLSRAAPVAFPANYDEEVRGAALRHGVDPDLAVAVHRQEYDPKRWVSRKGARGPMQLMPGTAKDLGVDANDPVQNIDGGVRYLKQQLDAQGGNMSMALAAYNAGPGTVERYGTVPPFKETRRYVQDIVDRYKQFKGGKESGVAYAGEPPKGEEEGKPSADYAGMLFRDKGIPQAEISAPSQNENATWGKPKPAAAVTRDAPDMETLVKAAFANDRETRFKIFAQKRFPGDPNAWKRYGIDERGGIYYRDDDGYEYPEIPDDVANKLRDWAANAASATPEFVGAIAGGVAGGGGPWSLPLAGVGAASGRDVKRYIGELLGDKPMTAMQRAENAAGGFVEGMAGQAVGIGGVAGTNRALRVGSGPIGKFAARDIPYLDRAAITRIIDIGKRYGIDVTVPEATGSPSLISVWNQAANTPGKAAELIKMWAEKTRIPQLQSAIERELSAISPETSVYEASGKAVTAARTVREGIETRRTDVASEMYGEAYKQKVKVETQPVIELIDDLVKNQPETGEVSRVLIKTKRILQKSEKAGPFQVPDTEKPILFGPNQEPVAFGTKTVTKAETFKPETRLNVLDKAKREIDSALARLEGTPAKEEAERQLLEVKKALTDAADAVSPEYSAARAWYEMLSRPLNNFMYRNPDLMPKDPRAKSAIARIADLPEGKYSEAHGILFGPESSVETVRHAKKFLLEADPDAWNAIIRARLQDSMDKLKLGDPKTVGARLRDRVFGTERQQEMLREAMDPQMYRRWSDFMDLLEVTNRVVYRNSQTAFQMTGKEMVQREAGGKPAKILRFIGTRVNPIRAAEELERMNYPEYSSRLVEMLMDPASTKKIQRIKQLTSGQEKAVQTLGIVGTITGSSYLREAVFGEKNVSPEYNPPAKRPE